nr:S-layer homology domain-containing protein [Clostridia bacterium]
MAEIKLKIIATMLLAICFSLAIPAFATEENEQYADALNTLGFFNGTGNGYELSRTPTRAEALVMLIRLLGEEKTALSEKNAHPFTDASWADAYIGYAYKNNLVKGMSSTEFGTALPMTNTQFATLLMRALGYSDDVGGQFTYDGAYEFALHKLAIEADAEFTRGALARLSYAALNTPLAFSEKTLAQSLMSKRVFTQGDLSAANAKIPKEEIKTTVIIYAVASDLESKLGMFSMDIDEIVGANPSGTEIIVQVGGTENYRNKNLADGKTQRISLTDGKLTVLEVLEDANMCDRQTLVDFLNFATEAAPADRYVLVFWDHGDGTLGGFGRDEMNLGASLSLSDMKEALASVEEQ